MIKLDIVDESQESINILFNKIITLNYTNGYAYYNDYTKYLKYKSYPKQITIKYPFITKKK
jgi:hypothetical protein